MSEAARIDLPEDHRKLVRGILDLNIPRGSAVSVFGSRATGRARPLSDLDLAIDAGRPLTLDELACLREAFSDRDLPYSVDVVDWQTADERFRQMIAAQREPLDDAAA